MNVWQDFVFEFLRNLYADDSTLGFDSFEEGYEYFLKARKIMRDASFELRKWETNLVEPKEKIYDEIKDNVSDIYPLGLLSPTTIQMNMLFQIICENKTLWDTILEKNLQNLWLKLL